MATAPKPFTVEQQLCFALYGATRAITSCYREGLEACGLTYTQYLVMLVLWERREVTLGEMSDELRLDSGTLSPLLKRLERQGLVSRRRGVDDERILLLSLTPAGESLHDRARAVQADVEAATGLDDEGLARLRSELHTLSLRLRGWQAERTAVRA